MKKYTRKKVPARKRGKKTKSKSTSKKRKTSTRRKRVAGKPRKCGYTIAGGRCRSVYKQRRADGTKRYFYLKVVSGKRRRHTTKRPRRTRK